MRCDDFWRFLTFLLDILETPVAVTPPQQEISKTLNSSKIPSKYLTFTLGEITFTFGEIIFTSGILKELRVLGNFYIFAGGVLGLCGTGGPPSGFSKISSTFGLKGSHRAMHASY